MEPTGVSVVDPTEDLRTEKMPFERSTVTTTEAVPEVANFLHPDISQSGLPPTPTRRSTIAQDVPLQSPTHAGDGTVHAKARTSTISHPPRSRSRRQVVGVALTSQDIYCRHEAERLYAGKLKQMPPPEDLEKEWREHVRPRLAVDVLTVIEKLPKSLTRNETVVELELCMAGYAKENDLKVDLRPTVWLRCGSKKCRKAVRSAVQPLAYLNDFVNKRIEIRCRGPYPAAFVPIEPTQPGIRVVDDNCVIHLHVETADNQQSSACGTRLLVTVCREEEIVAQQSSTIGGMISLPTRKTTSEDSTATVPDHKSILHGLTTGHGLVDLYTDALKSKSNVPGTDESASQSETDSDDAALEDDSEEESEEDDSDESVASAECPPGLCEDELKLVSWTRVEGLGLSTLGSSGSWVVRGSSLLGVIVASYKHDPYVHMIPAEKIFADINGLYGPEANPIGVTLPCPETAEEQQAGFVWNVPRKPISFFTGRVEVLNEIQRLLETTEGKIQKIIVITGIGGMGKSEICLKFVQERRIDFAGIVWVDVSNPSKATRDLIKTAAKLGSSVQNLEEAIQVLSSVTTRSLIVLDNADDPREDYRKYFPTGTNWSILFTSRNPKCANQSTFFSIKLGPMSSPESVSLLLRTIGHPETPSNESSAKPVAEVLGYHPLALVQAGTYIAEGHCSLAGYPIEYEQRYHPLLHFKTPKAQSRYTNLYTTFEASALELQRFGDPMAQEALFLLETLSLFHFSKFPMEVLKEAWASALQAMNARAKDQDEPDVDGLSGDHAEILSKALPVSSYQWESSRLRRTLRLLKSYSLITTDDKKNISMNSLIQAWARYRQTPFKSAELAGSIIALSYHSSTVWTDLETQMRPHIEAFLNNGAKLLRSRADIPSEVQVGFCCAKILLQMREDGMLHDYLSHIFEKLGKDPRRPTVYLLPLYKIAALNLLDIGNATDSVEMWLQIQSIEKVSLLRKHPNIPPEAHPSMLATLHELAGAYQATGMVQEAVDMHEHTVRIKIQTLPEEHPSLLASQHQLSRAYQATGHTDEAIQLLEHVVRVQAKTLAEAHPKRLASEHQLAHLYQNSGHNEKAAALLEHVVRVQQGALAETHPDRLASEHELACAYKAAGRTGEAVQLLEHVVTVQRKTLPEAHPDRRLSEDALDVFRQRSRLARIKGLRSHRKGGSVDVSKKPVSDAAFNQAQIANSKRVAFAQSGSSAQRVQGKRDQDFA
ncbi:hypothetical protein SLS56_003157 [Neofusicoccum ribis]|uniref:NB-ARC domain-containing protein n=1 Tax=Neofusicoccum ribis TaxID=45134 RepID=A0ABR3T189_9PEZI